MAVGFDLEAGRRCSQQSAEEFLGARKLAPAFWIVNACGSLLRGDWSPGTSAPTFRSGRGVPEGVGSTWPDRSPHLSRAPKKAGLGGDSARRCQLGAV